MQKCTPSIPPISRVIRDGKGRRKKVRKASKVDVSRGLSCDSTETALTTHIGPSAHRWAQPAVSRPPRIAEKTVQAPQGCSGGHTTTIFRAIQHGLGPPEPVLRGHQLLIPIRLCNHTTKNGSSPGRGRFQYIISPVVVLHKMGRELVPRAPSLLVTCQWSRWSLQ